MVPKLERKKADLLKALNSLEEAIKIAPLPLLAGEEEVDAMADLLRNGLLQKFEYNVELLWKTIQSIYKEEGLDFNTPKEVLRQSFLVTNLTEEEKVSILKMIDHRNAIAHEYKDYIMSEIYPRIPAYFFLMKKLYNSLK